MVGGDGATGAASRLCAGKKKNDGVDARKIADSSHLLILESNVPHTENVQLELTQGLLPVGDEETGLLWSPDGNSIAALEVIIRLRDGRACSFAPGKAWIGAYLNSQTVVERIVSDHVDREHPSSRFVLLNQECEKQDTWNVDDGWLIHDVSSARGLALVQ